MAKTTDKRRGVQVTRTTKETSIEIDLRLGITETIAIDTGVPFFDHMLHAMAFHGRLGLCIRATGDLNVDPHHTVEDVGLTLGSAIRTLQEQQPTLIRFGQATIPMDDALAEAVIDLGNRPYLVYHADFPQQYAGAFQLALLREFFHAFANGSRGNLHLACRYGSNGHHMAEALFKALGRAIAQALTLAPGPIPSTKGTL